MKRGCLTVALFAGLSLGSLANASVFWNFTSGVTNNTELGSSQGFASQVNGSSTNPNLTITAYGVHTDGSATDLYAKSSGDPTETGLGLAHGSEFEIDNEGSGHAIEIDVSSLSSVNNPTLQFLITSVQSGETFNWGTYNSATNDTPQPLSAFSTTSPNGAIGLGDNGSSEQTFNFTRSTSKYEFIAIFVSSTNGADVLLSTATMTNAGGHTGAPEPRFYGLLLVSLLAIPAIRRRYVPQQ
jgi:hypothetical protein